MQSRAKLAELGMPSIPSILPFPRAQEALDADGNPADGRTDKSADRFLDELDWYAHALKEARTKGVPY